MAKDDAKSTAPAKAKSRAPAKAKSFSKGKPFNKKTKPTTPVKPEKNESKTVTDAKGLWNKLRGEAEKEKIVALTDSLYELVSEQILALAKKHDTSRIIQCLIGHASPPQFSHILTTLKPALKDLATSQYSHFIVLKLIKKVCQSKNTIERTNNIKSIIHTLKGNLIKLGTDAIGARVVEFLLTELPNSNAASLFNEFYGREYQIILGGNSSTDTTTVNLHNIIALHPNSRQSLLLSMGVIVNKMVLKGLFQFSYVQRLMAEFTTELAIGTSTNSNSAKVKKQDGEVLQQFADAIADSAGVIVSSRHGATTIANAAAYGTAKTRKKLLKSFKGYVRSGMLHDSAYFAISRLVMCTDDTVQLQKSVLNELVSDASKEKKNNNKMIIEEEALVSDSPHPLLPLVTSQNACKLFLWMLYDSADGENKDLTGACKTDFDPWEIELLGTPSVNEEPTFKKSTTTKKNELTQFVADNFKELVEQHCAELLTSGGAAGRFLRAISGEGRKLNDCDDYLPKCVVEACQSESIFDHTHAHKTLQKIIEANAAVSAAMFGAYKTNLMTKIGSTNRGAFVLASMCKNNDETSKNVVKEMVKSKKDIEKRAKKEKGCEVLLKFL